MSRVGKATKNKNRPAVQKEFWRRPKTPLRFESRNPGLKLNEAGYAYVMVLAAVVVLAILAEVAYVLTSYAVKHDREEELLFRGGAYMRAIRGYYLSNTPGTVPTYPRNLTDLLADPRYLSRKKYIRALYKDPMGGDWSIVKSVDGGISGVASQSHEKPIKQANFPPGLVGFEGAQHYSDWIFLSNPSAPVSGTVTTQSPASAQ